MWTLYLDQLQTQNYLVWYFEGLRLAWTLPRCSSSHNKSETLLWSRDERQRDLLPLTTAPWLVQKCLLHGNCVRLASYLTNHRSTAKVTWRNTDIAYLASLALLMSGYLSIDLVNLLGLLYLPFAREEIVRRVWWWRDARCCNKLHQWVGQSKPATPNGDGLWVWCSLYHRQPLAEDPRT